MAKSKKKNAPKRRVRTKVRVSRGLDPYQSLLANPCAASIISPYGGERGVTERFVADVSSGGATFTSGVLFFSPCYNAFGGFTAALSNTSTLAATGPAVAANFFNSNVAKARPIAACMELIPSSLSITNITGELAMGVFDATTLAGGVSYTVDNIFALMNDREVIQKRDYELKWYPGSADYLYNQKTTGGALIAAEPSSQNIVAIAWRGLPAGTLLSFRLTAVYEWTPVSGLGLAVTSAPGRSQDWQNKSADLHSAHPDWWKSRVPIRSSGMGRPSMNDVVKQTYVPGSLSGALYEGLTSPELFANVMRHALGS